MRPVTSNSASRKARWRERNPERAQRYQREWSAARREANRERYNAYMRDWYARNRVKCCARVARYMRTARGRVLQADLKARRRLSGPIDREYAALIVTDPCVYCRAPSEAIDHIVPVAHGGDGKADNLAAACGRCNRQKGTTPLLAFLVRKWS